MTLRIGINGFGRIGRNVLRAGWDQPGLEFVHINDLVPHDMLAYLLAHDTVHGSWGPVSATDAGLNIKGKAVSTSSERDLKALPWSDVGVDVVLECTGAFTDANKAKLHREAGAPRVIISAPGKHVDGTFVVGVNHHLIDPEKHFVVSNASCTTNCLAPVARVLQDLVGIEHGVMTTVHAYTMDQNLLDAAHRKGKMRRSRAAAQNMVPTTTGAAKAIALVMPELAGRLSGMAIRVPTPNVSLVDLVVQAGRDTTAEEVNQALRAAAEGPMKGVLAVSTDPIVSSDLIGNPNSSIVDLPLTEVVGGNMIKLLTWYDNEWGFSNRMIDLARLLCGTGS